VIKLLLQTVKFLR